MSPEVKNPFGGASLESQDRLRSKGNLPNRQACPSSFSKPDEESVCFDGVTLSVEEAYSRATCAEEVFTPLVSETQSVFRVSDQRLEESEPTGAISSSRPDTRNLNPLKGNQSDPPVDSMVGYY